MAETVMPVGYGRISYVWSGPNGVRASMGLGFRVSTGVTAGEVADQAYDDFGGSVSLADAGSMVSWWAFEGTRVHLMTSAGLVGGQHAVNTVGTMVGGGGVPTNTAALIGVNTNLLGRQYRGRMYLPPAYWKGTDVDSTRLNNTPYTGLSDMVNQWKGKVQLSSAVYTPYLLHAPPKAGDTPAPTPIQNWSLQQSLATQRRRLLR